MSDRSEIEWTDATWNPIRGCTKISPGCKHCYAETFAERFRGVPGHAYEPGFKPRLAPEGLLQPVRWERPRLIFVNSMSDLFHEIVPDAYLAFCFDVMRAADWHTYQILTKRPDRMLAFLRNYASESLPPHLWIGVSVEDRRYGVPRIDLLRATPASCRFLSCEPLLEDLGEINLAGIDWLIVGGESGGADIRPMRPEWVRHLRHLCAGAGVAFFFKQWGEFGWRDHLPEATRHKLEARDHPAIRPFAPVEPIPLGKKSTGRLLDGRTWDAMPKISTRAPPPRRRRWQLFEDLKQRAEESLPAQMEAERCL